MNENINFQPEDAGLGNNLSSNSSEPLLVYIPPTQAPETYSQNNMDQNFFDTGNLTPTVESLEITEQSTFAIQGDMPVLSSEVQSNPEREVTKGFFGRRMDTLSRISKKADAVLTSVFGYELAEGVPITGRQALRARYSTDKLAHNAKTNIGLFTGQKPQKYDRMKNNVLRDAVYTQAVQGNHKALQYVERNDRNIGTIEQTATQEIFEAALVLSGAAAVRKVGLFAIMLVSLGGRSASKSIDKPRLAERFDKTLQLAYAKNQHEAGRQKYNERTATYNAVAAMAVRKGLSTGHKNDPFSF